MLKTMEDMDRGIVLNFGSEHEITLGDYIDHKINEALRNKLQLDIDTHTESNYTGGFDGRSLYEETYFIKISLLADIEDEIYFIDSIDFTI